MPDCKVPRKFLLMETKLSYKKVEFDYSRFFDETRVKCPFCKFNSSRTKTYKSLNQLLHHLSDQHQNEGDYYPFKLDDIKSLLKMIALAGEWGLFA